MWRASSDLEIAVRFSAVTLRGANIAFTLRIALEGFGLTHHEFVGTVDGDQIKGSMKVTPLNQAPITCLARSTNLHSDYFAPTGTATFRPLDQKS